MLVGGIYHFSVMKNCTNVKFVFKMYTVNIIILKKKAIPCCSKKVFF
jgi:hypothetical protein